MIMFGACAPVRPVLIEKTADESCKEAVKIAAHWWNDNLEDYIFDLEEVDKFPKRPDFGTIEIRFKETKDIDGTGPKRQNVGGLTSAHIARTKIDIERYEDGKCHWSARNIAAHEFGHHLRLRHKKKKKYVRNLMYSGDYDRAADPLPDIKYNYGWELTEGQIRRAKRRANTWIGNVFN